MRLTYVGRCFYWLVIVVLIFPFVHAHSTFAAITTISCGNDRVNEFITALSDANATPEADTIELSVDCLYTLTTVHNTLDNVGTNGLPVISAPLTIIGNGAIIERSTAAETPAFRLFHVTSTGALTLTTLTLRNGYTSQGFSTLNPGGAIYNVGGIVVLQDSTVTGNTAGGGGGIASSQGALTLQRSTVSRNTSTANGGGISATFTDFMLQESTVSSNTSTQNGGGVAAAYTSFTMQQSTLSGNTAGTGAGLSIFGGTATLQQSTLSGNTAINNGGGIAINSSSVDLETTLVASNTAGISGPDIFNNGSIASQGFNLIGSNESIEDVVLVGTPNAQGDWVGSSEAPLDPQLGPLTGNGGPTWTHQPLDGSPAVDHGPAIATFAIDQRGLARLQGAAVDIGAVEAAVLRLSAATPVTEGANALFTVSLDAPSAQTVTVDYATNDSSALAGSDYVSTTGTLTFTPGITETTILISTTDDLLDELDETFTVTLSNPSNAMLMTASTVATISDNDAAPVLFLNGLTSEEGSHLPFQVLLNMPSSLTITVDYLTSAGSATAEVDYMPISGTLTFTPGMTQTTVLVSTTDDLVKEPDENVTLLLSNPINGTLNNSQAAATINDNEGPLVFSIADISVLEGAVAQFTVTLNLQSSIPILVMYSTSDGSAEAGVDYTAITNTFTFAPGITETTFMLTTTADLLDEADETFTVTLQDISNAQSDPVSARATILDDDTTFTTYLPFVVRSTASNKAIRQR